MFSTNDTPLAKAEEIPSEAFIAATGASIALSLLLYATGRKQGAQFVGLWAPTIINLGLFLRLLRR